MGQIKEFFSRSQPLSRGEQSLRVLDTTARTFVIDGNYHISGAIADYRRQIEPTTGLSKQILLARAISDLSGSDGRLGTTVKRLGKDKPFASFFEFSITYGNGKAVVMGINLNIDRPIDSVDGFSVADALVEAEVAIENRNKKGEGERIVKRGQYRQPLKEFVG